MALIESEIRQPLYAKIRVAKAQLRLDEETYRDKIEAVTGERSLRDCSIPQIEAVLKQMRKDGFVPKKGSKRPPSDKAQVRMIMAIWADLAPYVRAPDKDAALRTFVSRQTKTVANPQGVSAPEFLDATQANRVIEALKDWRRRAEGDRA